MLISILVGWCAAAWLDSIDLDAPNSHTHTHHHTYHHHIQQEMLRLLLQRSAARTSTTATTTTISSSSLSRHVGAQQSLQPWRTASPLLLLRYQPLAPPLSSSSCPFATKAARAAEGEKGGTTEREGASAKRSIRQRLKEVGS
jgi:hypothetical protein